MITDSKSGCPMCGGQLKYYDSVKRIVRGGYGKKYATKIRRFVCRECGTSHRELPDCFFPYKHYEADIISGFVTGELTSFDIEYEDYPCETTVRQWKKSVHISDEKIG